MLEFFQILTKFYPVYPDCLASDSVLRDKTKTSALLIFS